MCMYMYMYMYLYISISIEMMSAEPMEGVKPVSGNACGAVSLQIIRYEGYHAVKIRFLVTNTLFCFVLKCK